MHLTPKLSAFLLFGLLLIGSAFAQSEEDVLYMRDSSILRGQVIRMEPQGNTRIQILGGSILVVKTQDVIRMEREAPVQTFPSYERTKRPIAELKKGYFHVSLFSLLISGDTDDVGVFEPRVSGSLQTVNGYRFHRLLAVGISTGIAFYGRGEMMPLGIEVRGNLMDQAISPIYYAQGGLNIPLYSYEGGEARSGATVALGTGLHFRTSGAISLLFQLGYRLQSGEDEFNAFGGRRVLESFTYQRIETSVGISF
ncbi:MAG: hypothetical protein AAGI38_04840 [Bacteroidota bacterium]